VKPSKPYYLPTFSRREKSIARNKDVPAGNFRFLTSDKIQVIAFLLKRFMKEERPYLKARYSIHHLAKDVKTPAYLVSAFINQELGVNFSDYFNLFRVRHCQVLIRDSQVDDFNLRGLARVCGFNNRNSFTVAFKKFTGMTPSVYKKNLDKVNELFPMRSDVLVQNF
jgi:AraC-like DNA-binding protein